MMNGRILLLAAVVAALPGAAAAQGGYPGAAGGGGFGGTGTRTQRSAVPGSAQAPDIRNPVAVALDDSTRLAITAEQMPRLKALSDSLDAENLPLLTQVQRTLSAQSVNGVALPVTDSVRAFQMEVLKSYFQRIRWNNDQTWRKAKQVLTHDQAKTADRLRRDSYGSGGGAVPASRPHGGGGHHRGGGGGHPGGLGGSPPEPGA